MINTEVNFNALIGKTLTEIEVNAGKDNITFRCDDGTIFNMFHEQDCCENVTVDDICGALVDILGSPIIMADESTSYENPKSDYDNSFTWTFYKLATIKGYVTIKWYGESNGYYSEDVSFFESNEE